MNVYSKLFNSKKTINIDYLKLYKSVYKEEAVPVSQISSDLRFCLHIGKGKDYKDIILYDKTKVINDINNTKNLINIDSIYCFGEIETSKANPYSCWSVIRSAAIKNYGAFLYDTMLSISGESGLIPDRGSVSKSARNVWEFYFYKRTSEFNLIKIDNFSKPETIDKKDDAFVHYPNTGYDNRDILDYIYYYKNYKKHLKLIKSLKDNHSVFLKQLSSKGVSPSDFKISLFNTGADFFSKYYNT